MNIIQSRFYFGDDFTLSRITIDGEIFPECPYVLEDKVRQQRE